MLRKLVAATLLLLLALPSAAAQAAPKLEFALQDDAVFVNQAWMPREAALAHAQQLGATRIRVTSSATARGRPIRHGRTARGSRCRS